MNYPAASSGVSKSQRLGESQAQQAAGNMTPRDLKAGGFPDDQVVLENRIRSLRAQGNPVTAEDIDTVEQMGDSLSLKLLTAPPEELLDITRLNDCKFNFTDMFGDRGDIINKDMPR